MAEHSRVCGGGDGRGGIGADGLQGHHNQTQRRQHVIAQVGKQGTLFVTIVFQGGACVHYAGLAFAVRVVEAEHVQGILNVFCDALSRGSSPESLGVAANEIIHLEGDRVARDTLQLCDPTKEVEGMEEFTALWQGVSNIIDELKVKAPTGGKRRARDWM